MEYIILDKKSPVVLGIDYITNGIESTRIVLEFSGADNKTAYAPGRIELTHFLEAKELLNLLARQPYKTIHESYTTRTGAVHIQNGEPVILTFPNCKTVLTPVAVQKLLTVLEHCHDKLRQNTDAFSKIWKE